MACAAYGEFNFMSASISFRVCAGEYPWGRLEECVGAPCTFGCTSRRASFLWQQPAVGGAYHITTCIAQTSSVVSCMQ